jgi:hypothetical protein
MGVSIQSRIEQFDREIEHAVDIQFIHDFLFVLLYGFNADRELSGDFFERFSFFYEKEHLVFAIGELFQEDLFDRFG